MRQQLGAAGAAALRRSRHVRAARPGRCGSSSARQERQRYGADGMGVTAGAAGMGVTAAAGRWPALDTIMVELQGTHGSSFGGGPEKELQWIWRTGVYALLDRRILLSRVTRL